MGSGAQRLLYPQQGLEHPLQRLLYPQQELKHLFQGLLYPQQELEYPLQGLLYPQQGLEHPLHRVSGRVSFCVSPVNIRLFTPCWQRREPPEH